MKLISSLIVLAVLGSLLALVTAQPGCAGSCASNCPTLSVYIGDLDNYELGGVVTGFVMDGPACPNTAGCVGDEVNTVCTHFSLEAPRPGRCDFYITFSDRPSEVVHLTFGPTQNSAGTCCQGYPPVGPNIYVIPDFPSGGLIYPKDGWDGGPTNVTLYNDGSTEDAARDAGADAPGGG
ncbi:MAG TPA: hypothetical protein VGP64_06820 [Polyangia bacterium]|jgi:hypothetical protein